MITLGGGPEGLRLRHDYISRLRLAGGLPLLLPPSPHALTEPEIGACLDDCQGVLFSGGGDFGPELWQEPLLDGVELEREPERDDLELALCAAAWERGMPMFGICRGLQLINLALGGDLYQDLDAEMGRGRERGCLLHCHPSEERFSVQHRVRVTHPALSRLIGEGPLVNSHHHQGIKHLAAPLTEAAVAPDGLCEAVLGPETHPLLAVQWHPECLDSMAPLFAAFVEMCRQFAAGG